MKHPLTGVANRTVARTSKQESASIGKRTTNLNYVEHDDGRDNETNTRMQLKLLPAKRSKKASSSTTKMIFSMMITTKSCTLMLVLVLLCVGSCARANNRTTANQTNRAALVSGAPAAASQSNNNSAPTDRRRAGGNQTSPARSSPKAAAAVAAHNSKPLEASGGIERLSEAAADNSSGGKLLTGPLASSGAIGRRPDLKSSELLDEISRPVRDGFDATRDGLARFTSIPLAGGHSLDIEQRHRQQQQQQNAYNEELSGFTFSNAPDDRSSFMFNPNDFQRPIAFTTSNSNPDRGPSSLARREEEKEKDKERPAAATSSPISRATIDNDNDGFASAARLQALSSGPVSGEIPHRFVNPTNGLRFPSALEPLQPDDGPALHYEQLASDPRHRAAAAANGGGGGIKVVFNNNPQFIIGRDQHADYNPSGQRDHASGQSGLVNLAEHLHSRRSGASSTMDRDPDESRLDETKARPCDKDTTQQQQQQQQHQEKISPQISNLEQIELSSPAEPVKPVAEPKQQPEPELKREPPAASKLPLSPPPPPEIKTTRIEEPSAGDQEGQVITPFEQIVKSGLRPPLRLVISMRNKNGDTMKVPINLHGSPKRKSFDLASPMQLHFEPPILEQKEDENTPAGGDVFDPSIVRPFSKTPAVAKTVLPEKAPLSPALPPGQQKGLPPSQPTPAAQPQPQPLPPAPQPKPLTNKKELPPLPPTDVEPQIKVVAEPAPVVPKKYDCAEQQQSIEETKQQQQQEQLAPLILGSSDGMLHMMVPKSTPSRSKTFSSMLEQFQKALAEQMSLDDSQAFPPSSAGDAANQLAAKEQQERQKQDDQEDLMVAMLAANVTSGGQQLAARQRMSMTVIKPPKGTTLSEAIRMHAQGGSPEPGRTVAILQSIGSRVNNNSNKNQAGPGQDAPLRPPSPPSLSAALPEVGRANDSPAPIATEIRLKQGGNRNPTQHRPAVGQANIGNGNNNNINNVNNEPVDPDGFSASSNVRTFYRHLFGGLDDEEAAGAPAGSGAADGSASNNDNNNNNFDASANFGEDDLGDVRRPNSSGGGQAKRVRRKRSSPAAGSSGDSKDSIAFAKSLEPSDKLPSAKLNSSSAPKIATTRPATVTTTTTTTTPMTTAMTSTLASTQKATMKTTTPAPPTKQAKLERPNKSKASKQPGKEMKPKRGPAKVMGRQQQQLMNKRMGSAGPSRGRGSSNLKDFFESAASEESEQRENEVPDYADDSAASDDDTVDASDSNDEPSSSNSAGNDYSSGSDSPDGDGSDDDSDLYSDGSGSSDESPDDEPFNQAAASSSPGGDYAASGSFEIPEIEINPNTLKQEGCRTVLKEVQEIPMNGLGAAAIGEPASQAGSNNMAAGGGLRRLRRHSDNLINSRKVTSIVMTKECHFPSGGSQSKPSANTVRPQPQTPRQSGPALGLPQAASAPISMESANQGRLAAAPAPAAAPHHLSRQVNQANPTPARHHFDRELAARHHQHNQMLLQQQQQQQQRLLAGQQVRRSPAPTVAAQAAAAVASAAQVNGAKMRRSVAEELQSAPRERNETPARDELGAASRRTEVIAQKLYKPPSADNPYHVLSISSKSGVDPDMESDEDDSFVMDSDNSGSGSAARRPDKRRRQRQPEREASASGRRLRMPQETLSERERKSLADPNYDDTDPVNQADEQEAASDGGAEQRRRQQRDELEADEEQQRRPSSSSSSSRRVAGGRREPDADESDADLADESSNTRALQVRQQQQQQLRLQQQPHQPAAPRQGGAKSQPPVPLGARLAEQARRMEAAAGAAAASLRQQPKQVHQQQLARRGAAGSEPAADQRFGRSFKFQHQLGRPQPSALMAQLQSLKPDRQGYVSISGAQLAPAAGAARRRSDESADPDEDEDSDVDEPDESSQDGALSGAQSRASREPQAESESEPDADPEYNPRESHLPAHTKPKRVQKSFAYVRRDLPRDGSPNSPDDFVVSYGRGNLQTEHEDYDSDREQPAGAANGAAAASEQDDERRRRAASTQLASYSPAQRAAAVTANPLTRRHDSPVAAAAGGFVRQHAQLTPADYLRRLTSHQQHQLARHNHHQQQLSAAAAAAAQQQQWQQPNRIRSLIGGGSGARSGGMSA